MTLTRELGVWRLILLGLSAVIGAGVFVLTGTASAQYAGAAVTLSYAMAGGGALLVALCYAELASLLPASGGPFNWAYAAFGRGVAWFVGWNLLFEYGFGAVA